MHGEVINTGAIAQLARRQLGVMTRSQVLRAGIERNQLARLLARGELVTVAPCTYRLRSAPQTWHSRLMEVALWAGSPGGASHLSAGKLWGLDGLPKGPGELHVLCTHGARLAKAGVRVHSSRQLEVRDFTQRGGIPVTHLARTLIDLASMLPEPSLELAVASARRRHPNLEKWLEQSLGTSDARRGRPGIEKLGHILRSLTHVADESALETRVWRRLRAAGVPLPHGQLAINDARGFIARVDFAWPMHRLVLFADGLQWHDGTTRRTHDAEQRNRIMAAGWNIQVVTWDMVSGEAWVQRLSEVIQPLLPNLSVDKRHQGR